MVEPLIGLLRVSSSDLHMHAVIEKWQIDGAMNVCCLVVALKAQALKILYRRRTWIAAQKITQILFDRRRSNAGR
jgi:hypothetical protein